MQKRSSEQIPIHLPTASTNTVKSVHPSSTSTAASSKPPSKQRHHLRSKPFRDADYQNQRSMIPKTKVQVLSNGSERRGGATPTRSEDPKGTVLPSRPVTADSQEEQSEIAKKLGESPEGDSMSNSGNQHELHLRNLSPSTEKIPSRNPKEPVRYLYRPSQDLVEKFATRRRLGEQLVEPTGNLIYTFVAQKTEQQVKTQVHHPRLSITKVTEQRIIGSLSSLGPASPPISRQPQEEPIRVPRRSLNKALKRDRQLLKFEANLRTWKLPARIFHQTTPPHKQYPSLGIAAAVQHRKVGRNETRRRNGYSGTTQVVHHQCSNESRAGKTYELKLNL
ncbi:uncharacterized protein EAF01_007772 [Botrytis porri]|uniref:uncharacterized protein n=1 Tax=Botrytis porri TaxID=87229 RepID=UPI0018FF5E57|nr:uncharacterized protein EAF01_007772 [Botrytis porri]KAF7900470.1 hypothetical protein EAF01_007772 [Botrytis porri]